MRSPFPLGAVERLQSHQKRFVLPVLIEAELDDLRTVADLSEPRIHLLYHPGGAVAELTAHGDAERWGSRGSCGGRGIVTTDEALGSSHSVPGRWSLTDERAPPAFPGPSLFDQKHNRAPDAERAFSLRGR